jgi:pentatricopeptide repeat protein
LISAWAFSGHYYGAEIAETIFDRMETSQIRLDTTTFNTLLSAWGRKKDPERATDILHHMFAVKKSGQYDVRPTRQSFAIVINAWAKTSHPRKAFKARELLQEMRERSGRNKNLKPNAYIYASVLNASAYTFGSAEVEREALSIAIETFKECTQRNDVVYGTFIKACNTLMDHDDQGRIELIKTSFVDSKQKGLVSDFVLHELYSSLSSSQYREILGLDTEDVLSKNDVPKRWSRNITKS